MLENPGLGFSVQWISGRESDHPSPDWASTPALRSMLYGESRTKILEDTTQVGTRVYHQNGF